MDENRGLPVTSIRRELYCMQRVALLGWTDDTMFSTSEGIPKAGYNVRLSVKLFVVSNVAVSCATCVAAVRPLRDLAFVLFRELIDA